MEGIGRFDYSVRAVSPVDLPRDTSRKWLEFLGPGVASGTLGVVAPPMFASGLVVGGLILAPGALILSETERRTWQRVVDALKTVEFEKNLLCALQRRGARMLPNREGTAASVELILNGYGFVGERPERVCFIANADLVVLVGHDELLRSRLNISDTSSSADAPPAQCSSMDRFAEHNGQMVLDTAAEYAEVLAAMAIDRIAAETQR